jgi:hypothetical protein
MMGRIVLWPNAKFSSDVPCESGSCRLQVKKEVPTAKRRKSRRKGPARKSSAERRKTSKGVLAGAMATVRKDDVTLVVLSAENEALVRLMMADVLREEAFQPSCVS